MSKLPKKHQFLDLSDYGRSLGHLIATKLQNTSLTPIHVTTMFIITGFIAIWLLLNGYLIASAFLLLLKSILDAADGDLARLKKKPSYVGRYYDSISDLILNFCFLLTLWYITDISLIYMIIAFLAIQLQGTLYNYYYLILRNSVKGDLTSRIFENNTPKGLNGESQLAVDIFYKIYYVLYIPFDKTIYYMDRNAVKSKPFPKWFMTLVSVYGLGFQLFIIALMLVLKLQTFIIPFFIGYSVLIIVFIFIRRVFLKT